MFTKNTLTKESILYEIDALLEDYVKDFKKRTFSSHKKQWMFKAVQVYPPVIEYAEGKLRNDENFIAVFLDHASTKEVFNYVQLIKNDDEDYLSVFNKDSCSKLMSSKHLYMAIYLENNFGHFKEDYHTKWFDRFNQKELMASFLSLSSSNAISRDTVQNLKFGINICLSKIVEKLNFDNLNKIKSEYYNKSFATKYSNIDFLTVLQKRHLDDEIIRKSLLLMEKKTEKSKTKARKVLP